MGLKSASPPLFLNTPFLKKGALLIFKKGLFKSPDVAFLKNAPFLIKNCFFRFLPEEILLCPKSPMDVKRYIIEKKGLFRPGGFLMENSENEMGHFGKKGALCWFCRGCQKATFLNKKPHFWLPKRGFFDQKPHFFKKGHFTRKSHIFGIPCMILLLKS